MGDQDLDYAPAQVATQDPSQIVVETPKRRRGRLCDPTKQSFAPLTPGRRPSVALCSIAVLHPWQLDLIFPFDLRQTARSPCNRYIIGIGERR
jgi:hypothetical protein